MALTPKDIERFKDRARKTPKYRGVPLRTNLSMEEVARYELNRYNFHGVDVTAEAPPKIAAGVAAAAPAPASAPVTTP